MAAWFPYHNSRLTKDDTDAAQDAKIAKTYNKLASLFVPPPRKAQASQEYARRLWDQGLGEVFKDDLQTKNEIAEAEEGSEGSNVHIGHRNEFARRMLNTEPDEIRTNLEKEIERDYSQQQSVYKAKLLASTLR